MRAILDLRLKRVWSCAALAAVAAALAAGTTGEAHAAAPLAVLAPSDGSIHTGSTAILRVRARGVSRLRVRVNGTDVTRRLRSARRGVRTAPLRLGRGLERGTNRIAASARTRGGRRLTAHGSFVLARRGNGLIRVRAASSGGRKTPAAAEVVRRRRGVRFTARLNGRDVRSAFDLTAPDRFVAQFGAQDGLRFGPNRLVVTAATDTGRLAQRVVRRFTIRRDAPLAGAGRDRSTKPARAVRLDGRSTRPSRRGNRLALRWLVVQRPRGARVRLRNARSARPTLTADRPGRYRVELRATERRRTSALTGRSSGSAPLAPSPPAEPTDPGTPAPPSGTTSPTGPTAPSGPTAPTGPTGPAPALPPSPPVPPVEPPSPPNTSTDTVEVTVAPSAPPSGVKLTTATTGSRGVTVGDQDTIGWESSYPMSNDSLDIQLVVLDRKTLAPSPIPCLQGLGDIYDCNAPSGSSQSANQFYEGTSEALAALRVQLDQLTGMQLAVLNGAGNAWPGAEGCGQANPQMSAVSGSAFWLAQAALELGATFEIGLQGGNLGSNGFTNEALATIGCGMWSIVGVPQSSEGQAYQLLGLNQSGVPACPSGPNWPCPGSMTGYLQRLDGDALYTFTWPPESNTFDTQAPGSTPTKNIVQVDTQAVQVTCPDGTPSASQTFTSDEVPAGQWAYQVVWLNADTLNCRGSFTFPGATTSVGTTFYPCGLSNWVKEIEWGPYSCLGAGFLDWDPAACFGMGTEGGGCPWTTYPDNLPVPSEEMLGQLYQIQIDPTPATVIVTTVGNVPDPTLLAGWAVTQVSDTSGAPETQGPVGGFSPNQEWGSLANFLIPFGGSAYGPLGALKPDPNTYPHQQGRLSHDGNFEYETIDVGPAPTADIGSYTLVGTLGLNEFGPSKGAELSQGIFNSVPGLPQDNQIKSARLTGNWKRNRQGLLAPGPNAHPGPPQSYGAGTGGDASPFQSSLTAVLAQPPQPWPTKADMSAAEWAAMEYIGEGIGAGELDQTYGIRAMYWEALESSDWNTFRTTVKGLTAAECMKEFPACTEQAFTTLQEQLAGSASAKGPFAGNGEFGAVQIVAGQFKDGCDTCLYGQYSAAGGQIATDLQQAQNTVVQSFSISLSDEIVSLGDEIREMSIGALSIASGLAGLIPEAGEEIEAALDVTEGSLEIAGALANDSEGQPVFNDAPFLQSVDQFITRFQDSWNDQLNEPGLIAGLLVSDQGRLATAMQNLVGDGDWLQALEANVTEQFANSAQQAIWRSLLPAGFGLYNCVYTYSDHIKSDAPMYASTPGGGGWPVNGQNTNPYYWWLAAPGNRFPADGTIQQAFTSQYAASPGLGIPKQYMMLGQVQGIGDTSTWGFQNHGSGC